MLKKTCILFLGLVAYIGSACVTPTHASSAFNDIVLVYVQAASPMGAKDEMVTIYNNSANAINVSNWCLVNKSNVKFACVQPPSSDKAYFLLPYSYIVFATDSFIDNGYGLPENISIVYPVTNQSSGSIVNSGDSISLVDELGDAIDSYSWSTAIPAGKVAARAISSTPFIYETLDSLLTWSYVSINGVPESSIDVRIVEPIPIDEEEPEVPTEEQNPEQALMHAQISELLPNPAGSDTGNEFIEIFNPNPNDSLDLSQYRLRVGLQLEKTYAFPEGSILAPLEYRSFPNSVIKYTLLNSTSSVQLDFNGELTATPITYSSPKEGKSWAYIDSEWAYSSGPTPNLVNSLSIEDIQASEESVEDEAVVAASALKPCATNQYRSLETNRCRLIASSTTTGPTPCAANQYRHPETNRCRKITATDEGLAPCKVGQERSLETNRCRNIVAMSKVDHGVKGVSTEASAGAAWYWWLGIVGVVGCIIAYAVWEWRDELRKFWAALRSKVARIKV